MLRRIGISISILIFVLSAMMFFLVLNFAIAFGSPEKIKANLQSTGSYNLTAFYIKESVAVANNLQVDEGENLEALDIYFSPDKIRPGLDELIDKIYFALAQPEEENLVIELKYEGSTRHFPIKSNFVKTLNFQSNSLFLLFTHTKFVLTTLALLLIVSFLAMLMVISKTWNGRLKRSGSMIAVIAILIMGMGVFVRSVALNYYDLFLAKAHLVEDQKLIIIAKKVIDSLIQGNLLPYIIEFCALIIIAVALRYLSNLFTDSKAEQFGKSII